MPIYNDIMRHYYLLRSYVHENRYIYFQPEDDFIEMFGKQVTNIWIDTSMPVFPAEQLSEKL